MKEKQHLLKKNIKWIWLQVEQMDNKFDMELKKLDTEHNALQTEYDSVKSVIDKNVEKTFNIFS